MDIESLDNSINKRAAHIFRDMEGHFQDDTPNNRQTLIETVLNPENYRGIDRWGNDWYTSDRSDGGQIWVQVRKGEIINGDLNLTPRSWNSVTGFSRSR